MTGSPAGRGTLGDFVPDTILTLDASRLRTGGTKAVTRGREVTSQRCGPSLQILRQLVAVMVMHTDDSYFVYMGVCH